MCGHVLGKLVEGGPRNSRMIVSIQQIALIAFHVLKVFPAWVLVDVEENDD